MAEVITVSHYVCMLLAISLTLCYGFLTNMSVAFSNVIISSWFCEGEAIASRDASL